MWEEIMDLDLVYWILIAMFLFLVIFAPLAWNILKEQFGNYND